MASISLARLLPTARRPVDEAREVGAIPIPQEVTAMRVGRDQLDRVVYEGEVPIYTQVPWRTADYSGGRRHRWYRFEAKVGRNSLIKRGDELVVAEYPYGNGWLQHVRFKPPWKKKARERPVAPDKIRRSSQLVEWIENELEHDFWENRAYLTAGISVPDLPLEPRQGVRIAHENAFLIFGVCENFKECEAALHKCESVTAMLDATERNTIRFSYTRANLSVTPRLSDEVIAERHQLMCISIRQALAGPHKESDEWVGRPAVDKVSQIYRAHLNALNRRVAGRKMQTCEFRDWLCAEDGREAADENR